jgi:hypothetical protein
MTELEVNINGPSGIERTVSAYLQTYEYPI